MGKGKSDDASRNANLGEHGGIVTGAQNHNRRKQDAFDARHPDLVQANKDAEEAQEGRKI
jgi:hypothetical protein